MPPLDLEKVLDDLVSSYGPDTPLNRLETHALPNRRAVIEVFNHLLHVLYVGFYSRRQLDASNLRLVLAEHVLRASEALVAQIRRAAAWADRHRSLKRADSWAEERVQGLLEALPHLREVLHLDVEAAYRRDPAAESMEEVVFSYPSVYAVTAYRLAHRLYVDDVPMIPRILTEHAHERTGIDIHPGAKIGRGFFMDHGTGVVIGQTSEIGDEVQLYQNVTLGALSVRGDVDRDRDRVVKRHPTLEDRVTVYAGTTILGGDTVVGADSVIGGNVWLTRSVPPKSRVFHRLQAQDVARENRSP
ncbi:MAG: serine acetyltransferase [Myxococcota bacterium]